MEQFKYREANGFIHLARNNINVEDEQGRVVYFTYNNKKYEFKRALSIRKVFHELVGYYLAKDFGFDALDYDIAFYNGSLGTISESLEEEKKASNSTINIGNVFSKLFKPNRNTLDNIWLAVEMEVRKDKSIKNKDEVINYIMNQIVNIFLFDVLISNTRRDLNDIYFIKDKGMGKLSNNDYLLSNAMYDGKYGISVKEDEDTHSLLTFLNMSDSSYAKILKDKLSLISDDNLNKIFDKIEEQIGDRIPIDIREEMLIKFRINRQIVSNALDIYEKKLLMSK